MSRYLAKRARQTSSRWDHFKEYLPAARDSRGKIDIPSVLASSLSIASWKFTAYHLKEELFPHNKTLKTRHRLMVLPLLVGFGDAST